VVIAAPEKQKYGAEVAGTVFRKIADKVYATHIEYHEAMNLKQQEVILEAPETKARYSPEIIKVLKNVGIAFKWKGDHDTWVMTEKNEGFVSAEKRFIGNTTMPNVVGMGLKD